MKISILEKVRAPSRIEFRKGLGCEACCPRLVDGHGNQVGTEDNRLEETSFGCHDPIAFRERLPDEVADHETDKNTNCCSVHIYLLKEQFSAALLPQKLSVSYDSNNTANIACMGFKVKPNRKSLYLKAFSRPLYYWIWIKKFSSPKIKIWFEPMFFCGFFCKPSPRTVNPVQGQSLDGV